MTQRVLADFIKAYDVRGVVPDQLDDEVARAIGAARRPVLVVGPEVDAEKAGPAMVALAERIGAPVWTSTFSSRLSFPEDHPLFAGHLHASPEQVSDALAAHDLVLVIGSVGFLTMDVSLPGFDVAGPFWSAAIPITRWLLLTWSWLFR